MAYFGELFVRVKYGLEIIFCHQMSTINLDLFVIKYRNF